MKASNRYLVKTLAALAALTVVCALGGCASPAPQPVPESSSSAPEPPPSIALPTPESSVDDAPLMVADAAMYRGTVTEIEEVAKADSNLLRVTLKSAEGTGYTPATVSANISTDTKLSFEKEKLEVGAYLEVYYGAMPEKADEPIDAIAVNLLTPAELSVFNGELVGMIWDEKNGQQSMLLKSLVNGMETLFHISEDTQLYVSLDELKEGDKLNIYTNGAATLSIPPQASAIEVRAYVEPKK